jgi:hypothetical protein
MEVNELAGIFGRNLSEDLELRPLLEALLGLSGHKPLDCVGTIEELRAVSRQILQLGNTWPLLEGITPDMIDGPDIGNLVRDRAPANIAPELASGIDRFVAANL